jgi:hypothetical protein
LFGLFTWVAMGVDLSRIEPSLLTLS